jgi:hypothetical protein
MWCAKMFGVIVPMVVRSGLPIDKELALVLSVSDPVKPHVHCFGLALLDSFVGDATSCEVIGLNWGGRLGMPHKFEGSSDGATFLSIEK